MVSMKRFIPLAVAGIGIVLVLAVGIYFYQSFGPRNIRMAVSIDDAPYAFQDPATQQLMGMDVDILNVIAKQSNLSFELVGVKRTDLLGGVASCRYDAGIGLLVIPSQSDEKIIYSDPYFQRGQTIIVRAGNTEILGRDSLTGRQVGVLIGSKAAEDLSTDAGVFIVPYETVDQMFQALTKGNVQAVVSENDVAVVYVAQSNAKLISVGTTFNNANIGIAVCPKANIIRDRINREFANLKSTGTIDLLFKQWLSE
jgi:ABC-type amino acid transport substrate-binding protein